MCGFAVCVIFKCDFQSLTKSEIREETEEEVSQVQADEEETSKEIAQEAEAVAAKIEVVSNFTQTEEDLKPPTPPPVEKVETPPPDLEARETQVLEKLTIFIVLDDTISQPRVSSTLIYLIELFIYYFYKDKHRSRTSRATFM